MVCRWLRRGRRLLRHLWLSHHRSLGRRGGTDRPNIHPVLLHPSDPSPSADVGPGLGHDGAPRTLAPATDTTGGICGGCPVCRLVRLELAIRWTGHRLLRRGCHRGLAGSLLVAVDRGAVLSVLAGPRRHLRGSCSTGRWVVDQSRPQSCSWPPDCRLGDSLGIGDPPHRERGLLPNLAADLGTGDRGWARRCNPVDTQDVHVRPRLHSLCRDCRHCGRCHNIRHGHGVSR